MSEAWQPDRKGGLFQELKALPKAVRAACDEKLMNGVSASKVAKWLHAGGHMQRLDDKSLMRYVQRYRVQELRAAVLNRIAFAQKPNAPVPILARRLNALEEMEKLVEHELRRLAVISKVEEGKPMLVAAVSNEISRLHTMLVDLANLQLATGHLPRAMKQIHGLLTTADGETHKFSWTEEQDKILAELEQFRDTYAAAQAEDE